MPAPKVSSHVGRYEVVGLLATGGMAEVLLGRLRGPSGFERPVVIKRILPHLARVAEFRQMFLDEARVAARIRHRNVVSVHELGEDGQDLFLVMEYLEGESLASLTRLLKRKGVGIPARLGAYVVAEACAGLHAAHELKAPDGTSLGLVHRDVSPHNVFVLYDGQVKVIDFGIAKAKTSDAHTKTGQIKGKFAYMAPEQCIAEPLDRRADVFALGILLFEATTGTRLFERDNDLLVLRAICQDPLPRPSSLVPGYPESLEAVCMKALARGRDERYESAAAMRRDLIAALRDLPGEQSPEEELAALVQGAFSDRVVEKRAMLDAIARGSEVTRVPPGEDSMRSGDSPGAPRREDVPTLTAPSEAVTGTNAPMLHSGPAPSRPERKRVGYYVAGGLAIVALGLGVPLALRAPSGSDATASSAPAAPSEPIVVHVSSSPPGAEVWIAGVQRGSTPVEVSLPRGTSSLTLELRKPGYETATDTVTADRDQRFSLTLREQAPPAASATAAVSASAPAREPAVTRRPAPPAKPPPTSKPTDGFHRFD